MKSQNGNRMNQVEEYARKEAGKARKVSEMPRYRDEWMSLERGMCRKTVVPYAMKSQMTVGRSVEGEEFEHRVHPSVGGVWKGESVLKAVALRLAAPLPTP